MSCVMFLRPFNLGNPDIKKFAPIWQIISIRYSKRLEHRKRKDEIDYDEFRRLITVVAHLSDAITLSSIFLRTPNSFNNISMCLFLLITNL